MKVNKGFRVKASRIVKRTGNFAFLALVPSLGLSASAWLHHKGGYTLVQLVVWIFTGLAWSFSIHLRNGAAAAKAKKVQAAQRIAAARQRTYQRAPEPVTSSQPTTLKGSWPTPEEVRQKRLLYAKKKAEAAALYTAQKERLDTAKAILAEAEAAKLRIDEEERAARTKRDAESAQQAEAEATQQACSEEFRRTADTLQIASIEWDDSAAETMGLAPVLKVLKAGQTFTTVSSSTEEAEKVTQHIPTPHKRAASEQAFEPVTSAPSKTAQITPNEWDDGAAETMGVAPALKVLKASQSLTTVSAANEEAEKVAQNAPPLHKRTASEQAFEPVTSAPPPSLQGSWHTPEEVRQKGLLYAKKNAESAALSTAQNERVNVEEAALAEADAAKLRIDEEGQAAGTQRDAASAREAGASATRASQRPLLDPAKIAAVQRESERVSALLADIFKEEISALTLVAAPEMKVSETRDPTSGLLGLDAAHSAFARMLLSRSQWSRSELLGVSEDLELMLDGAIEQINEMSFETYCIPFTEGNDPIEVNPEILEKLEA